MARKIEVEVVGDTAAFERSMRRSAAASRQLGGSLGQAESRMAQFAKRAAVLGGIAGLGAIAIGTKSAISAASNLNESINAVNVTFGKSAVQIKAFGRTAATEAGLSARAFNESATVLGAALNNAGFSVDETADKTIQLTKRAADMASVFNTDVDQALGAIQAALRGESDPIERFGVGLNEAAVNAKALELGLAKTSKEVDAHDKAQARLALIMEQTNKVAGDFKNTSDGAANSQRVIRAELENTAAAVGTAFLPMVERATGAVADFLGREDVQKKLQEFADLLANGLAKGFELVGDAAGIAIDFIKANWGVVTDTIGRSEQALKNSRSFLDDVAEALGGWNTALVIGMSTWAAWKTAAIGSAVAVQVANIRAAAATAAAWRAALIATGWGIFAVAAGVAAAYVITHWEQVKDWFQKFRRDIVLYFRAMWADLREGVIVGVLRFLEPLSHIPTKAFQWARDAKKNLENQLANIDLEQTRISLERQGKMAGTAWAIEFAKAAAPIVRDAMAGASTTPGSSADRTPSQQAAAHSKAGAIQLGTSQTTTHLTSGLSGFPAKDWFATPGTPVLAPENGRVVRWSGHGGTSGQVYGWSLYYVGAETGNTYYITHLASNRAAIGGYKRGDVLGYVSAWDSGSAHAHVGIQKKGAGSQTVATSSGGGGSSTTTATKGKEKDKADKAAKAFEPIPIRFRVQLAEAELTKGDADDERVLKKISAYLRNLLKSKKISPADRLEVTTSLKQINDQIETIEDKHADALKAKAAKKRAAMLSAYKGVAAAALKEFDKLTEAGLSQFDALTPGEVALSEFRNARADEERNRRRNEAAAIEDPYEREQALRQLDLEDQEMALEDRAKQERAARDKEREAYKEKRDEDRTRLEQWLSDQDAALQAGKKSWNQFYRDLREIAARYGFPVTPLKSPPPASKAAAAAATSGILFPTIGSAAGGQVLDVGDAGRLMLGTSAAVSTPTVNVYVAGSVATERDISLAVAEHLVRIGRNNGGGMGGDQF